MLEVRPFIGLLYDPAAGKLEAVTAPPYDVISPMDQARLYRTSLHNAVRLILGRDEPGDDSSNNKYTRAGSFLRGWREAGLLRPTPESSVYPYELAFQWKGERRGIRGLVAAVRLEPWGGSIVPHERTLPGPIQDRLSLLREVRANLSPVYAVLPSASVAYSSFLESAMACPHDREVTDESGTRHRLWVTSSDTGAVTNALREETLMIADGHHRYTVALAYRDEMRGLHGAGPWDDVMMFIVDGGVEDPPVLPIHRVVHGDDALHVLGGTKVRDMAEILASVRDDDLTYGIVRREDGELIHRVAGLRGPPPTVCALHAQILDRLPSPRIRYVPDSVMAEQAVMSGEAATAYLLPPTRVELVWRLVQARERLPEKSTYFWPKPRTGMVIRPLDV